ncbi:MAG: class I SAM-dependent methyltransferase, partial [Verrucomicrobiia bacterium]
IEMLPLCFDEVRLPAESFDAVVFLNVLEHLPSPSRALAQAAELLRPTGIVFVEVPYIFTLAVKIFGKKWFHFEPTHYYYFSEETLGSMMQKAGLRVLEMCFLPKFMSPAVVVDSFAKHMPFVNTVRGPLKELFALTGLERRFFRLKSRDFLGVIAQKCG